MPGRTRKIKAEDVRNPVFWFVLALVIEQPSHGYEINQRYERRLGAVVPTSVARVYGALERLHECGLIEEVEINSAGPMSKREGMRHSYQATRPGVEAYRGWLGVAMVDDDERPRLVAPIVAAGLVSVRVLLDAIDRFEERCLKELHGFNGVEATEPDAPLENVVDELVRDQRRRELESRCDWAVNAREVLLEREDEPARSPRRQPRARTGK